MKKYIKGILIILLIFVLTSCDPNKKHKEDTTATTDYNQVVSEITLIENNVSDYIITYPISASMDVYNSAVYFQTKFQEITGLKLNVEDDYLKNNQTHDPSKKRILVGNTNYDESKTIFKELKYYDYRVTTVENKLVIAAHNKEELYNAINALITKLSADLVDGDNGKKLSYSKNIEFFYKDYQINSFTVAGVELKKFKFVYSNESFLEDLNIARERIARRYGYYLEIVKDSSVAPTDYEILIGNTNRSTSDKMATPNYLNYEIAVIDNKLVLKSGGIHSMNKLLSRLSETFTVQDKKVVLADTYVKSGNYYDDPFDNASPVGSDIRVMSCNILAEYASWGGTIPVSTRKEIYFAFLDYYQPSVIGLQEVSPQWYNAFNEYSDIKKYSVITKTNEFVAGENLFTAIVYRNDLLNVIDSNFVRYTSYGNNKTQVMVWALFEVIATGDKFIFLNTHWDGDNSQHAPTQYTHTTQLINSLKQTHKVPIICTADWNSNEQTTSYKYLLEKASLKNAKVVAQKRLNNIGSWHDLGKNIPSAYSCDHIFVTDNLTVLQFETAMYNEQIYASDHAWLIADIKFN